MSISDSQETTDIAPISRPTFHQLEECEPVNVGYRTYAPEHTIPDVVVWYRNLFPENV